MFGTDSTTELLQKHFDLALEAPEGIAKLRELILTLAMQGKLVPQDPNDEPARELVAAITAQKVALGKGPGGSLENVSELERNKTPLTLPESWSVAPLGDCAIVTMGQSPESSSYNDFGLGTPFFQGKADFGELHPTVRKWCTAPTKIVKPGDILLSVRAPVGPTNIAATEACIGRGLCGIRCLGGMSEFFLLYYFHAQEKYIASLGYGSTFTAITLGQVRNLVVPLPPLPEQRRIVAKIDQLMTVCDQLEKQRDALAQKRLAVHNAAIRRLLEAEHQAEFTSAGDFLLDHFAEVYAVKENVAELRKAILQLAVMGKLVKQDPNDEPASELLKAIEEEKLRLVKEGKIKAPKPLPPIAPEEVQFAVPKGWEWVRLGKLVDLINGDRGKNYPNREEYVRSGIPWINTGHIEPDGSLSKTEMHYITRPKFESLNGGKIQKGDLVYCLRGATLGKTAFVDPLEEGAIASSLVILRPFEPVSRPFLYRYLTGPLGRSQIFRFDNGSAQPNLSAASVQQYYVPLPPLPEQHRIVAKVNELMALCDRLEAGIDAANAKKSSLLKAVLAV